ncbi:hypothetical protein [Pseudoalteromonas sp. T1lg48]|uniref:hypothetical protein n=1 Tax=Pseudoalteromonas sp. T1lg48 TaxID=2077100 RepID=UPI000CF648F2|nr:hypothetical protein [Pseudoalteromonas sp. T1lg48]
MLKKSFVFISAVSVVVLGAIASYLIYHLYQHKFVTLDPQLREVSGIEFDKHGRLWAINDGGNGPYLYQVDDQGQVKQRIEVTNAKNIDWEDMTQNEFGHFFLGDFGNNKHDRRWLTIYKIENPIDIKSGKAFAEIIKFTYKELWEEPMTPERQNFDLEAFVEYKHKLYLFTKNRTRPFDGKTNLYRIGNHADNYEAEFIGSFKTCTTAEKLCWVTSAAMSPDRTTLALLDSTDLWLFKNWQGDNFFSGEVQKVNLGIVTQKEAVTFYDNNTVVIADEEFQGIGRNIYVFKLDEQQLEPMDK